MQAQREPRVTTQHLRSSLRQKACFVRLAPCSSSVSFVAYAYLVTGRRTDLRALSFMSTTTLSVSSPFLPGWCFEAMCCIVDVSRSLELHALVGELALLTVQPRVPRGFPGRVRLHERQGPTHGRKQVRGRCRSQDHRFGALGPHGFDVALASSDALRVPVPRLAGWWRRRFLHFRYDFVAHRRV